MLKHTKGNLIDLAESGEFDIIVHGCNCRNTMGSGIAKEIRERYPVAFNADLHYISDGVSKLGNYSEARVYGEGRTLFTIVNAYTQLNYLPRGVDHFDYESFKLILRKLAVIYPKSRFGFPYIGMGLAGGDPEEIKKILWYFSNAIEKTGGSVTLVEFG
jgi:O-acetyl-ADP-ribose deacetylase (regulator of RNase III)